MVPCLAWQSSSPAIPWELGAEQLPFLPPWSRFATSVTHFPLPSPPHIPSFEVLDTEQIAGGLGLNQERLLGCFLIKIDPSPCLPRSRVRSSGKDLALQKQLVRGIQSPTVTGCRNGLMGKRSPKIIQLEFHLQQGCPRRGKNNRCCL